MEIYVCIYIYIYIFIHMHICIYAFFLPNLWLHAANVAAAIEIAPPSLSCLLAPMFSASSDMSKLVRAKSCTRRGTLMAR